MNTPTLIALAFIAALVVTWAGFVVHKTGSAAGVRAIGPLLATIIKAFNDLG